MSDGFHGAGCRRCRAAARHARGARGGATAGRASAPPAHRPGAGRRRGARLRPHRRDPSSGRKRHQARSGGRHLGRQPGGGAVRIGQKRRRAGRDGGVDGRVGHHRLVVPGPWPDPRRSAGALRARTHRWSVDRAHAHSARHRRHRPRQRCGGAVSDRRSGRGGTGLERGTGGVSAGAHRHTRIRRWRPGGTRAGAVCAPDGRRTGHRRRHLGGTRGQPDG